MSQALSAISSSIPVVPSAHSRMIQALAASTTGATAKATTGGASSSTSSSGSTDLGSTFLNLLSTELQNQDPTAPVDSTAMVGQMISLNQLDQLISINQSVGGSATGVSGLMSSGTSASPTAKADSAATASALDPTSALNAAQTALPFDPNTMMPINTVPATQINTSGVK